MRLKATAIALGVAAVIGYGVMQRNEPGGQQRAAGSAPASNAAPPAAFADADKGSYTPGDDVTRYVALETPTAAFDAWKLIHGCQKAERHDLVGRAERCNGITQEQRGMAGALLGTAMMAGVHGAAVEYVHLMYSVPRKELEQARRDNPNHDKAVRTALEKLEEVAPRDLQAIRLLARLYKGPNAITGERNAEASLKFFTAEHELQNTPEKYRAPIVAGLTERLTPEQVKRAREAGLQLARHCDCKEG